MVLDDLSRKIVAAVDELDRDSTNTLTDQLIHELKSNRPGNSAEKPVARALQALRRKRFFKPMGTLAKEYLDLIPTESPKILLQLIQALIDQGKLLEAKYELEELAKAHAVGTWAGAEARGLLGRVHKQSYVDRHQRLGAARRSLGEAIQSYIEVYREDSKVYWWQGINAVACLARAERDRVELREGVQYQGGLANWRTMAETILDVVAGYDCKHDAYTWAMATAIEACVALERQEDANLYCEKYINAPYADVFELGSTERQFREVWELDRRDVAGAQGLSILQGRLGALGGDIAALTRGDLRHQALLGTESARAVRWLERLLDRASSVARIHKDTDDTAGGSGFLVKTGEFDGSNNGRLVLLTNHHVVNEEGEGGAIPRVSARVNLTRSYPNQEFSLGPVLWSDKGLDATLCAIDLLPAQNARLGLPLGRTADLEHNDPKPRLYVIGHPKNAPLKISLYDNRLIEIDRREDRLRYRSPTEDGSSGSPVLDEELNAVAIHHATRLAQPANQGVLLDSIRGRIAARGYL